jgi:hypothetical protein
MIKNYKIFFKIAPHAFIKNNIQEVIVTFSFQTIVAKITSPIRLYTYNVCKYNKQSSSYKSITKSRRLPEFI